MQDISGKITYRGKEYRLVFNLNVMERIQEEYGSLDVWGSKTDGSNGEPDAKAIKFGFTEMINEGIDIANEETDASDPPFTAKQVGRIITEVGLAAATSVLNTTVVESTKGDGKNG